MTGLSFTAIDFETANAKRESVCAVGLAKVRDGKVVEEWTTLVRPPQGFEYFHPINIGVHGIRPADVLDSPGWDVVHAQVEEFVGCDDLVAHNASFDRSVFTRAGAVFQKSCPSNSWFDTLAAARRHLRLPNYKLPTVSAELRLAEFAHHDAGADATQAALVAIALAHRTGAATLQELVPATTPQRKRRASTASSW